MMQPVFLGIDKARKLAKYLQWKQRKTVDVSWEEHSQVSGDKKLTGRRTLIKFWPIWTEDERTTSVNFPNSSTPEVELRACHDEVGLYGRSRGVGSTGLERIGPGKAGFWTFNSFNLRTYTVTPRYYSNDRLSLAIRHHSMIIVHSDQMCCWTTTTFHSK
jgi:hypothetical protein